jgi:hypothetical protein
MDTPVTRYDPGRARKAQRYGKERGVRIYIAAEELIAAGIDPEADPPTYRVWPGRSGGVTLRLYKT